MQLHVLTADGDAKHWLEPAMELAKNHRLADLRKIERIIKEHDQEIRDAWKRHFGS